MSSRKVDKAAAVVVLLLIVLSACTAVGRELAQEKTQKVNSTAAYKEGATGAHPRDDSMVKTNDYGRYDPTPAFSKPRFKLIPN